MNLDDLITSICETIKRREVVLFVGAGISIDTPSRLPSGIPLRNTPVEGILASYPPSDRRLVIEHAIADLSLEEVYGVIHDGISERLITTMAKALDDDRLEPNKLHHFIAKALSFNNIGVTTNYDGQIERAFAKEAPEKDLEICYDEKTFETFINNFEKDEQGWLLKLHGTFKIRGEDVSKSVATTLDRVGRGLPSKTNETLRHVLKEFPLLFLGYGCGDLDIVYPVLAQVESKKEIWWVKYERKVPEKFLYVDEEIQNLKDEIPHITTVLLNRVKNGGRVFLLRYPTSWFIEMLKVKLGWKAVQQEGEGLSEDHWKGELFCLGNQTSQAEKSFILAALARLGRDTEQGRKERRKLTEFMQREYDKAIEESKDKLKLAHLHRDLGFSWYLVNRDLAMKHYKNTEDMLKQVAPEIKPLLDNVELLSLYSLAYRRAYQITEAFKYSSLAWEAIPEDIRSQLKESDQDFKSIKFKNRELTDREKSNLGRILRRLANAYHDLVSDPVTLSTAIKSHNLKIEPWITEPVETKLLEEALRLVRIDRELQRATGNIRELIQSENVLGLIVTKLSKADEAKKVHEESQRVASQLNWIGVEYAQACRNLGLAIEKEGFLDQAINLLEEARDRFTREEEKPTTNWHIGRILIKKGDVRGIYIIEEITKGRRDWHWRGNDLALLGIGYYDLLKNKEDEARKFFKQMLKLYEDIKDDMKIKSRAYGIDNALANVKSAYFRLCFDGKPKEDDLCVKLQSQKARLERMRDEALKFIASSLSNMK